MDFKFRGVVFSLKLIFNLLLIFLYLAVKENRNERGMFSWFFISLRKFFPLVSVATLDSPPPNSLLNSQFASLFYDSEK